MTTPALDLERQSALADRIFSHFDTQAGAEVPEAIRAQWQRTLAEPAMEFVARPSKGLRASIMEAAYLLAGGSGTCPQLAAVVIEALHAGSLIVDDIEDDSQTRRGLPALHVQCGLASALNTGNWLYFWALEQIEYLPLSPERMLRVLLESNRVLTRSHQGQALDLGTHVARLPQSDVATLVRTTTELKTGALMGLACAIAAEVAGAEPTLVGRLQELGAQLGVALQMLDDLSGLLNDRRRDKGEEDLRLGRATWPWAWLAEALPASEFEQLQRRSRDASLGEPSTGLARELREALNGAGRVHVRRHLAQVQNLFQSLGTEHEGLERVKQEIHLLEKSYG